MDNKDAVLDKIEGFYPLTSDAREKLVTFVDLIQKWNQTYNLVSHKEELWARHILDSAQLLPLLPKKLGILTDVGSGGGFPALILGICAPLEEVRLIESNGKKAQFLREAIRVTGISATVYQERVEDVTAWKSDVITARAFRSLPSLLPLIYPFSDKECLCLFLKGCKAKEEVKEAKQTWDFDEKLLPSISGEDLSEKEQGWIVTLRNIRGR